MTPGEVYEKPGAEREDKRECRYHSYHSHTALGIANRWFAQRYNVNNAWNFNGNNGNLNNNNVNNGNQVQAVTKLSETIITLYDRRRVLFQAGGYYADYTA